MTEYIIWKCARCNRVGFVKGSAIHGCGRFTDKWNPWTTEAKNIEKEYAR